MQLTTQTSASYSSCLVLALVAMLAFCSSSRAQSDNILFRNSHSRLQEDFESGMVRPEITLRDRMLSNPAALRTGVDSPSRFSANHALAADSLALPKVAVAIVGNMGDAEGDRLPWDGDAQDDASVEANGFMRSLRGTFLGKAAFTLGRHDNVGWSAQRNADLYWPYVVGDSTGGRFGYETYNLLCAYSFDLGGSLTMGFSGEYVGDFAYRKTDPRVEDISSWLDVRVGLGGFVPSGGHWAFDVRYQHQRQNMAVKHFRSGQFCGFFMEYGFGQFDLIFSPIFNSMSHLLRQHSVGASAQWMSAAGSRVRSFVRVGFDRDMLTSEENTYKIDLYEAATSTASLTAAGLWRGASWGVSLTADGKASLRQGRENIFERYVCSDVDGVNIYDYRKIGQYGRYRLKTICGSAQLKVSHFVGTTSSVSLIGAADLFGRKETYTDGHLVVSNLLLTPKAGAEFDFVGHDWNARVTAIGGWRRCPKSEYHVGVAAERNTEFQHAFSPFAYYAHEGGTFSADATVSRRVAFGRMGVALQFSLLRADRLTSAAYDADRYAVASPRPSKFTVSLSPDVHNANWASVTIFAQIN